MSKRMREPISTRDSRILVDSPPVSRYVATEQWPFLCWNATIRSSGSTVRAWSLANHHRAQLPLTGSGSLRRWPVRVFQTRQVRWSFPGSAWPATSHRASAVKARARTGPFGTDQESARIRCSGAEPSTEYDPTS
ncbi:hypothetical protein EBO15_22070 [Actinomadura harenae]|uniref:Uncharacterized protein n=1 Tax=Actinomadura harenae TaxID=2483351 RepID=A0A3M2LZY5_9ACTN|nr:hypothetical protein EBO15_22070 [Actinomadura harenae]